MCFSNDDSTVDNTKEVSYDFFIATVAGEFNLLDLKIICRNSIESSIISEELKKKYLKSFEKDWKFLSINVSNNIINKIKFLFVLLYI